MKETESTPSEDLSPLESTIGEILWLAIRNREEIPPEIDRLKRTGVHTVRLGIDCAEFCSEEGDEWYDWLLPVLGGHFELELCFDNFSRSPARSVSRKRPLPEIVEHFILMHGKYFTLLELWRNPSSRVRPGASENIFAEDAVFAATWAKHWGKKASLGGIQTLDFEWISKLSSSQFLRNVEFVEIDREDGHWNMGIRFCGPTPPVSPTADKRRSLMGKS